MIRQTIFLEIAWDSSIQHIALLMPYHHMLILLSYSGYFTHNWIGHLQPSASYSTLYLSFCSQFN